MSDRAQPDAELVSLDLAAFVARLGSDSPTPGGGSVAALVAALAAGLGGMVTSLSRGKKRYAEWEDELQRRQARLGELSEACLAAIRADEEAFIPLTEAWRRPADDPGRPAAIAAGLETAAAAPRQLLALCEAIVEAIAWLPGHSSPLAVSDIACSAALARAAAELAQINILVNTRLMDERGRAEALIAEADAALARCRADASALTETIEAGLRVARG